MTLEGDWHEISITGIDNLEGHALSILIYVSLEIHILIEGSANFTNQYRGLEIESILWAFRIEKVKKSLKMLFCKFLVVFLFCLRFSVWIVQAAHKILDLQRYKIPWIMIDIIRYWQICRMSYSSAVLHRKLIFC